MTGDVRRIVRRALFLGVDPYDTVHVPGATLYLRPGAVFGRHVPSVCVIGAFDGLHMGHRALIDAARIEASERSLPFALVTFVPDVDALDLEDLGPQFEHHKLFPEGVNTEFVQILDGNSVKFRVWERGSGETLACGTGACAVTYACMKLHRAGKMGQPLNVYCKGGLLKVTYAEDNHLYLTGPAVESFTGEMEIPDEEIAKIAAGLKK